MSQGKINVLLLKATSIIKMRISLNKTIRGVARENLVWGMEVDSIGISGQRALGATGKKYPLDAHFQH